MPAAPLGPAVRGAMPRRQHRPGRRARAGAAGVRGRALPGALTRTEGTGTKGAANFAHIWQTPWICAPFCYQPTPLVNLPRIRPISRKFGKFCIFPHFFDLHPRSLHPRLFRSNLCASLAYAPRTLSVLQRARPDLDFMRARAHTQTLCPTVSLGRA